MSQQLNVQQQNASAKAKIQRTVAAFQCRSPFLAWLPAVLASHGLSPEAGALVRLSEIPEQEGNLFSGVWLTQSREFWEFEVVVSRSTGAVVAVERFENTTPSVTVSAHQPDTGKSFGCLALEVLNNVRGG
jgi:hypothetical protein